MSQSNEIKSQINNIDNVLLPTARIKLADAKEVISKAPGMISDAIRLDEQGGCPEKFGAKNASQRKKKATEIDKCQREAREKKSLWRGYLSKARADESEALTEIETLTQTRDFLQSQYESTLEAERTISKTTAEAAAYEQKILADKGLSFTALGIEAEASGEALMMKAQKQAETDAEIATKKAKVRRNVTILVSIAVVLVGGFWAWNKFKK